MKHHPPHVLPRTKLVPSSLAAIFCPNPRLGFSLALKLTSSFLLSLTVTTAHAALVKIEVASKADGKPVADAVLTLTPVGKNVAPKAQRINIDQIDKEFVPRVNVTSTGSSVYFPNKDDIRHQIYSFSTPKKFEQKLYSGTQAPPVIFDKPGLIVLGCNIHDWMLGYLVVTDAPYYGKTDIAGKLDLKDVPAGDYEVRSWHPNLPVEKMDKLTVTEPGSSLKLVIELSAN